jgi:hypothetical protein
MLKFIHLLAAAFAASIPSPSGLPSRNSAAPRRTTHGLKAHRAMTWDGYHGRNHASSMWLVNRINATVL